MEIREFNYRDINDLQQYVDLIGRFPSTVQFIDEFKNSKDDEYLPHFRLFLRTHQMTFTESRLFNHILFGILFNHNNPKICELLHTTYYDFNEHKTIFNIDHNDTKLSLYVLSHTDPTLRWFNTTIFDFVAMKHHHSLMKETMHIPFTSITFLIEKFHTFNIYQSRLIIFNLIKHKNMTKTIQITILNKSIERGLKFLHGVLNLVQPPPCVFSKKNILSSLIILMLRYYTDEVKLIHLEHKICELPNSAELCVKKNIYAAPTIFYALKGRNLQSPNMYKLYNIRFILK